MTNELIQEEVPVVKPKKLVERSAAYPAISIEEALQFVETIYKNFPGSPSFSRDDVSAILKSTNVHREVAACSQYGFLNRHKEFYQVSELYKTIYNHLTEVEKRKCLLEAFGMPKLYQELIEKHDGHVIPTELKTHLIRFHKIAEKAAPEVAELFLRNARFVGAANEHNILNYNIELGKLNTPGFQYAEVITENEKSDTKGQIIDISVTEKEKLLEQPTGQKDHQHGQLRLPDVPNADDIKIPLSEKKFALLRYPSDIKKIDIEILRKQLDLLELLAE